MSKKGDDALLRARQQFRSLRTTETLKAIEVPEWGITVHYWPTRSVEERLATEKHIRFGERTKADLTAFHVAQVVHRSRDEQGFRLWTDDEAKAFEDTHPAVLERISLQMGLGDEPTIEDAEKN